MRVPISKIAAGVVGVARWAAENLDPRDLHAYGGISSAAIGVYCIPGNVSLGGALLTAGLALFYLGARR